MLLITPAESRGAILASTVSGLAKIDPQLEVVYFDGTRADDVESLAPWLANVGIKTKTVKARDSEAEMAQLSELIKERGDEATMSHPSS